MNDELTIPKNKEPYIPLTDSHELNTTQPIQLQMTYNHDISKYDCIDGKQMTKGSNKKNPVQMQMPNDIVVNIDEPESSFNKQSEQAKLPEQPEQPEQPKQHGQPKINNAGKTIKQKNNEQSCLLCCSCCCETADDIATCYLYMWLFSSMQHETQGNSNIPCLCKCDCCNDCNCNCDCDCDCDY